MPRLMALEWNDSEARVAVASLRGKEAVLEQAFSVSMLSSGSQPVEPGQRLAAALAARGVGRLETLVAIGRTNIELRQLTVPPAPEEELPDMVRFQALREFNAMQEDWALDYLPIDESSDQPQTVLAAAIAPEQVEQVRQTCQKAGVKPKRLVLRPCAAASLFCRRQADGRPRVRLLVDLLEDETDLTVMVDRKVIFLRTARLPGDPLCEAEAAQALVAEFRRTMAAVQNQLGGRKVESIVLCGSGLPHGKLAELIDERLGVPTELFDPFTGLKLAGELGDQTPEHSGRFAPLLGMLLDELHGERHTIDFLHPRRRPAPPSRRPTYLLAVVAALLILVVPVFYIWMQRQSMQGEIEQMRNNLTAVNKDIAELSKAKKAVEAVDQWRSGDAVWLDEMRWLVEKFPAAKDAKLTELTLTHEAQGPKMRMEILAKSSEARESIEKNLFDEKHHLIPDGELRSASDSKEYAWQFGGTVTVGEQRKAAKTPRAAKGGPR